MSGIKSEYPESESFDAFAGVLVRDEPDDEEEEDEGAGDEDGDDDEDYQGYSE